jgi:hypothetical protein
MGVAQSTLHRWPHGLSDQDRKLNRKQGDLDKAIRHLNEAIMFDTNADYTAANAARISACFLLERIGPELLVIDPEAKL